MSEVEEPESLQATINRVVVEYDYPASALQALITLREWVDQIVYDAYHAGYEDDPSYHDKDDSLKLGIDLITRLHDKLYDEHFQIGRDDRALGVPNDEVD